MFDPKNHFAAKESDVDKAGPSILLLSDDAEHSHHLKAFLESRRHPVHLVETKNDALAVLERHPIPLCIMDIHHQRKRFLAIGGDIKEAGSNLKLIVHSADPDHRTAVAAMRMGAFDYISSDISNHELLETIQQALTARHEETSNAGKHRRTRRCNTVLLCRNTLIKEGINSFCLEHPPYHLLHTYKSLQAIEETSANGSVELILACLCCSKEDRAIDLPDLFAGLSTSFPCGKIVVINCHFRDDDKIRLMKMGVRGFLPKNIKKSEMKKALDAIVGGRLWVNNELTERLLDDLLGKDLNGRYNRPVNLYRLSKREMEIMRAIASGLSNLEICDKLFISENTVKVHINHIFKKLEVKSRTQAIIKSAKVGLI